MAMAMAMVFHSFVCLFVRCDNQNTCVSNQWSLLGCLFLCLYNYTNLFRSIQSACVSNQQSLFVCLFAHLFPCFLIVCYLVSRFNVRVRWEVMIYVLSEVALK